jgi:hypothetical protein
MNGLVAVQTTPQLLSNGTSTSLQCQPEVYGDIGPCSMGCKTMYNSDMITSLDTFTADNFTDANCTLVLQSSNTTDNSSYLIPIPSANYLIYFSNSSMIGIQLLCNSNILSTTNTSVMCQYIYSQPSFNNTSCPSTAVTNRYIPPGLFDLTYHRYE